MQRILIIDDDRDMCLLLKRFLSDQGYGVSVAYSSKQGLELLSLTEPQLVLCDFRLDSNDGKAMLLKIKEMYPELPVIIITGYSDIRVAVEVMKLGAYDYITKPIFPDEIVLSINTALKNASGKAIYKTSSPRQPAHSNDHAGNPKSPFIFTESPTLSQIVEQADRVAPGDSVVLYGESGTGKEVIAHEIHRRSHRHEKAFAAIVCGALPRETAALELFGHEKAAVNGVAYGKPGIFEKTNGGTVFLDEIAHLSPEIQDAVLRILQERKLKRMGSARDIAVDVRIITASNEKLSEASRKGKCREGLFQHLNEYSITVPPLRERKEDIMLFATHFLQQTSQELGKKVTGFSPEVENIFHDYLWYGNLRELRNVVKKATLLTDGEFIEDRALPFEISNFNKLLFEKTPGNIVSAQPKPSATLSSTPRSILHETTLKEVSIDAEYEMILEALKQNNFNKSKAARFLNIDRKTLYNKMRQYQQLNTH